VLAAANVNALASASFKSIVTTDPHSFNTIRNEYPDFGGKYEIEHYTTLAKRLFTEGRLRVANPLKYRVTFHDPCHLGRFNKGTMRRASCWPCSAANSSRWGAARQTRFAAGRRAEYGYRIRWAPRSLRRIE